MVVSRVDEKSCSLLVGHSVLIPRLSLGCVILSALAFNRTNNCLGRDSLTSDGSDSEDKTDSASLLYEVYFVLGHKMSGSMPQVPRHLVKIKFASLIL